jgi:hypothetical protein
MVVLSHGLHAAAEVDPRRADGTPPQGIERARTALGERQEIPLRSLVEPAEQRQDLVADQPALRLRVGRVGAERKPDVFAVRLRLVAPDAEQRADDAVLAPGLDPAGLPARHQPVENGLDLVGCRVAGGAQPAGRERVAEVTQLGLGRGRRSLHDLGAEDVGAEPRVLVRLVAAQTMVHVQRGDRVPELAHRVPQRARVRTARDETRHVAAGRDQVVPADLLLDAIEEVHRPIVAAGAPGRRRP